MKKKFLSVLLSVLILLCVCATAFAADNEKDYVCDMEYDLTYSDELDLEEKIAELIQSSGMDIVIVTTDSFDGQSAMAYADDFFDYLGYGQGENRDGLLLLVSMQSREWWISTSGRAIDVFTDEGIQYIGEKIVDEGLSDGDCRAAFDCFIALCDDFIRQAESGSPYDVGNMPHDTLSLSWILISLVVGFILAIAVVGSMKKKLKSVSMQAGAANYVKSGSMMITENKDIFLYSHIARRAKPKSSGGSGGGSSTHSSSSGSSHGGGGGRF